MTLDEARRRLGVTSTASVAEIRAAFRRRARAVHPDLHADATAEARARLGREFSSLRDARDLLERHETDRLRRPQSQPQQPPPQPPPPPPPPPPPSESSRPQSRRATREARTDTPPQARPPRVTMRFDEFVAWTDAAGFGAGQRSRRVIDWARIIAWSIVGVLGGSMGGAVVFSALA